MKAIRRFAPLFLARRSQFLAALLLSLATLLAGAALLALSGWFLTAAFLTTAALGFNLFGPSSAVRGLSLLRILSRYGEKLVGHDATLRVLSDIRAHVFREAMPRFAALRRDLTRGDLVQRLTGDVEALDVVFLLAVGPMVTGLCAGGLTFAVLLFTLPGAAPFYGAAFLAATVLVPLALARAARAPGAATIAAAARLREAALDTIEGQADLRLFAAMGAARQRFAERADALGRARRALAARSALATAAIHILSGAALIGTLLPGLAALQRGAIGAPLLVGLTLAVLGSFEAVAGTVRSVARLGASVAAAERLDALSRLSPGAPEPVAPVPLPEAGALSLRGVRFGHRAERPILAGLDLDLHLGERIAIEGPSGCGKSTLLSLLVRLEVPTAGRIAIGGQAIERVASAELRRRVMLLEQDAPVFLGTVADNLRIGRPDADEDALWEALDRARLADFVASLPAGLETWLGEGGRTLSVGQARRLVLARALLSPAAILLLDEPTSGLDPETESAFFRDLPKALAGRSVLLATHARLPAGVVDRVLRLDQGRLTPL